MSEQKTQETGKETQEEVYELVFNPYTEKEVRITNANSFGRKCEKCGCNCPCTCEDCRPYCCSSGITRGGLE